MMDFPEIIVYNDQIFNSFIAWYMIGQRVIRNCWSNVQFMRLDSVLSLLFKQIYTNYRKKALSNIIVSHVEDNIINLTEAGHKNNHEK